MKKYLFISLILSVLVNVNINAQTYEELVNRSADYIESKDYLAAEQVLKLALRKEPANPNNTLLLSNLGTVQRELKKYDEALVSYNAALIKYPDLNSLLHNRAALYCDMDSLDSALNDYDAILLSNPDDIEALYRRGYIYLDRKELELAQTDFEHIKHIDPDNLSASMGLAFLLKRKNEWEKAEELYSDLLYNNRNNAELYLNRAECYIEMKKLARAQSDLDKASSLGLDTPLLYILKGQLRLRQYDKFSARQNFLKAKELGADKVLVDELLLHCK
ncbi:MAG: tetratricopeptide repeat protein [Dysgonomonas sp.]